MRKRISTIATTLAALALIACGADGAIAPGSDHATMRVGLNNVTVVTLGQSIVIDAAVVGANGQPIPNAEIAWDVQDAAGVLAPVIAGRFTVVKEGTARIAAVWTKDPSVRATVTVSVDAGLLASACIVRLDQKTGASGARCAQQRVVVGVSTSAPMLSPLDAPLAIQLPIAGARR